MLAKELSVDEDTSTRLFKSFLKSGIHQKVKHVDWMKVLFVKHLSPHRKKLLFLVQVIQVFISSIAQCFISVLIVRISMDAGQA